MQSASCGRMKITHDAVWRDSVSLMNVVSLLGSLGLFLYGMRAMGDGLERAAGSKLRRVLELVTRNRVLGMLAGVLITAVIQSSSAATVMVVGFVNAQLLSLNQAVGVIMGANIGTTVTPLLLSVKLDFGAIFACIGFLMSGLPRRYRKIRRLGQIAMGLGILFVGMNGMANAVAPLRQWPAFREAMVSIDHPALGVLIGVAITAVLQSSSASVGILQALAGEGLIPLRFAMFILFGQNIGTCVTSLIACAGTSAAAKRAAVVHLLFNVAGAALFFTLALVLPLADWIETLSPGNLRLQIATVHILFNAGTTALLLPTSALLERTACLVVRDGEGSGEAMRLKYFDERLFATPAVACAQLFRETRRMGDIARSNLSASVAVFFHWDEERAEEIEHNESVLNFLSGRITAGLAGVNGLDLNDADKRLIGSLFHVVVDLERVGDLSVNIAEAGKARAEQAIRFSAKADAELDELSSLVAAQLDEVLLFFGRQSDDAARLHALRKKEKSIDLLVKTLREHHVERLKNRKCTAENGILYHDMLTNLERVADHAENVAESVDHATPVGLWN